MAKTILQPLVFLAISAVTFLTCYFLAATVSGGTIESDGLSLILVAMVISFAIHWILFVPSYIFQTEKFYDLTGSLTYITVLSFVVFIKKTNPKRKGTPKRKNINNPPSYNVFPLGGNAINRRILVFVQEFQKGFS